MSKTPPRWLRPTVDYGPLIVFFLTYVKFDLYVATGAFMAATAVALLLAWFGERRLPTMLLVTAGIVLLFGGLTLFFEDDRFIKMKPTIVQALFAVVLLGGLALGRPLLKPLFGTAWKLTERGWRLLTLRFGLFFAVMAVVNEAVWRTQSTDFWVNFKVFGAIALTFAFTAAQIPLIMRYSIEPEEDPAASQPPKGG